MTRTLWILFALVGCQATETMDLVGTWERDTRESAPVANTGAEICAEQLQVLELREDGSFAYLLEHDSLSDHPFCPDPTGLTVVDQRGDWQLAVAHGDREHVLLMLSITHNTVTSPNGDEMNAQRLSSSSDRVSTGESLDGRRLLRLETLGLFWEAQ